MEGEGGKKWQGERRKNKLEESVNEKADDVDFEGTEKC